MQNLIDKYKLEPHPEGGYYREIYRSSQKVVSSVIGHERDAVTHIYFLLCKGQISRFHKVLHDEVWNFYEGAPLKLVILNREIINEYVISPRSSNYAEVVPAGSYQAAETTGEYSLVGCTVAPGFDFKDFSFMSDDPDISENLRSKHPEFERFI
jgi:predicted cupin superfamily sugar epimerase